MRRCFECGKWTDAALLTAVGDGEFCAACFRQLLAAGGEPSARRPVVAAPAPAAPPRHKSSNACLVCERAIEGDAAVSFLGGDICAACNAQMARELHDADGTHADPTATDHGVAPAAAEPASRVPASRAESSFTPGAETRWCAGCERPMPGPGSYRILAGEPYCPACVPFYSVLNLGAHPRHPAAPAATGATCDCCGAPLDPGAEPDEGFRFCRACVTSDRELALGVARARHRRKVEALRAALDGGKKS